MTSDVLSRGGYRGNVTKLIAKLAAIDENVTPPFLEKEQQLYELQENLKDLVGLSDTIEALDAKIIAIIIDDDDWKKAFDDISTNNQVIKNALHLYGFKVGKMEIELNPFIKPTPPPPPPPPARSRCNLFAKYDLPDFSGILLEFQPFWDIFEVEVDQNPSFSGATKFNYLNSKLKGEAKDCLLGMAPTNANYDEAVKILKERYGNKSKLVAALMRALYNLPSPTDSRLSLRQFSDRIETYIRSLDSLNKKSKHYGDFLVCILLDKLTANVRRNLVRHHGSTEWAIDELRAALIHEVEILDDAPGPTKRQAAAAASTTVAAAVTKNQSNNVGNKRVDSKDRSAQSNRLANSFQPHCQFCDGDHSAVSCKNPSKPKERYEIAKKKLLCFNCLYNKHTNARECPSASRCRQCGKKHYTSLHFESTKPAAGPTVAVVEEKVSKVVALVDEGESVPFTFLKTAVAPVEHNRHRSTANILLDEGAQKSFISSRMAAALFLQLTGREALRLSGFVSSDDRVRLYDVTKFTIIDRKGEPITINAVIVDHIVNPLEDLYREAVSRLPHFTASHLPTHLATTNISKSTFLLGPISMGPSSTTRLFEERDRQPSVLA